MEILWLGMQILPATVQPSRIDLSIDPKDVLGNVVRWMLHHWTDARALNFKVYPTYGDLPSHFLNSLETIMQAAGTEPNAPAAVREFKGSFISQQVVDTHMVVKDIQGMSTAQLLYISEGPMERLCARLLSLMLRLTTLNLSIPKAPQLPPFKELEHLELHCIGFEGMQHSLNGLQRLKTLFLYYELLHTLLSELHLAGLPNLGHVRLDDVFPIELSLPPGCRLDVMGEAAIMDKVIGVAWQDALQHLHACTCKWTITFETRPRYLDVQGLPTFLPMAAGCIQELSLVEKKMPAILPNVEHCVRLDPAVLCNLRNLWVRISGEVKIHIPAAVHLTSFQIYVDLLLLSFEDANVSCMNLTDVNVLHRPTKGGSSVVDLLREPLAKNGVHLRTITYVYWSDLELVTSMPPSPHGDVHEYQKHFKIFQGSQLECT